MENYFVIGKIVNTQGIKGEVRVLPTTDDINRFKKLKNIIVSNRGNNTDYDIESVRFHKQFVLLKLKGIDDMSLGEKLKNSDIKIPEQLAIPCENDEYYIRDLYDMEVVTFEGEYLGVISDIIFTGANDVYIIKSDKDDVKDLLIPAIKQCILNVDVKNNRMTINLMDGLR